MSGSPDNTVEEGEDVCREDDSNDEESSIGQRSQPSQVEVRQLRCHAPRSCLGAVCHRHEGYKMGVA